MADSGVGFVEVGWFDCAKTHSWGLIGYRRLRRFQIIPRRRMTSPNWLLGELCRHRHKGQISLSLSERWGPFLQKHLLNQLYNKKNSVSLLAFHCTTTSINFGNGEISTDFLCKRNAIFDTIEKTIPSLGNNSDTLDGIVV